MVKYQARLELITPLVNALAELLNAHYSDDQWPEVLVPVPLHKKRLRERGYDQSFLLARALAKQLRRLSHLSLTIDTQLITRTTHSPPQQGLNAKARLHNIRNAFTLTQKPTMKHVALIDDVVTTGATVSEITKLLKKHHVERVDIWTIARTPEG